MRPERMFKTVLLGVEEEEVLIYMDRLLAVIERQREKQDGGARKDHEFLLHQMRKDLDREFQGYRRRRTCRYILIGLCPILCLVLILFFCCFQTGMARVTGDSMSPSLKTGDLVFYHRNQRAYERGEMVVCDVEGIRIVKRVAGVPGDIIRQNENGTVRITSSLEERRGGGMEIPSAGGGPAQQIFLKQDEYFLLGDNRDLSVDSRDERIGPVLKERIEGSVFLIIRNVPENSPPVKQETE